MLLCVAAINIKIPGRPRVEVAMCKHTGHAKLRHLRHVVPANHLPLVSQNRIDPRVVWTISDRVVVKIGN